ncbi:MAG: sigma-70 family RNA polymerase sigma factor, partial [Planctomycetes bacterium]|nr:sigma-70 family RNA polymerase sigma factor [Planctomycetota bacterium]
MLSSRIDRAFRRYLRTRDPSALGRVFDAVAPELYRLAWHLTGDRHVAEDLVQTTFLVALQDGGSFETDDAADGRRGRVVPWLYGILTNRVLDWRRQAKRRAAPAPDGFDVANDDPAAGAAARELRDDVARAIRVLPEPYRQVLLLHLVHELAPKEIAEALARPAATVRVQLRRGLELLRRGLPAGVAGLARAAMPVPVGLAIVRERVLANVAAEVGAVSMTAAGSGIVFGGLLAMKKLVAFAALLVAGLVLWTVWPRGEIAPRSVEGGLRADPAAAASEPASLPADRGGDSALAREAVDPPPAADATAGVELLVRWHDGTPAANVTVRCLPRASTNAIASADDAVDRDDSLRETVGRTGGDGVVRFVGLYAPRVRLTADRGGDVEIELVRGSIQRGVLDLSRGYDVTGRVVDLDDRPIAGATVWLSVAEESDDSEAVATSAADGRFEIRSVGGDRRMLTATAPGFGCAKVDWVSAERATRVRLLRLRPVPGSLVLTVVDHDGAPIAGAHVLVGVTMSRSDGSHHRIVGQVIGQDHWPSRFGRTDDLGVFHAEGLPPLSWPIWVGAPGHAPVYRVLDIADAGVTRATLQLTEGARVHGRVIDAEGRPAAGALVGLRGESGAVDYVIGLGMEHVFGPPFWARAATRAGDDGRFLLERAMAGTAMLHANDNVAHVAVPIELAPGQVVERDLCFGETRL